MTLFLRWQQWRGPELGGPKGQEGKSSQPHDSKGRNFRIIVSNKNVKSVCFTGGSSLTLFWYFYRRSDKEGGERRCFLQREWRRQRGKEDHFVLQVHTLCGTSWFIFILGTSWNQKALLSLENNKNQSLYQEPMSKALKSPSARVCGVLSLFQIFKQCIVCTAEKYVASLMIFCCEKRNRRVLRIWVQPRHISWTPSGTRTLRLSLRGARKSKR